MTELTTPARWARPARDFLFGTATAAYQIEGGVDEGGRGPSIWDTFAHTPGRTHRGDTGDIACDHYHRWESDLDLMAELGLPAYRLSLSWARLQPTGSGALNPDGVAFYRAHRRGLPARAASPRSSPSTTGTSPSRCRTPADGPHVTPPTASPTTPAAASTPSPTSPTTGSRSTSRGASRSCRTRGACRRRGYATPPQAIRAAHHTLLAHGLALQHFRDRGARRQGRDHQHPEQRQPAHRLARRRRRGATLDIRMNRIFLEPCYHGEYPDDVVEVFGPDGLNAGEADGGSCSPVTWRSSRRRPTSSASTTTPTCWPTRRRRRRRGGAIEQVEPTPTSFGWSNTPSALRDVSSRVSKEFSSLPILVTENGASFHDYVDPDGEVRDVERIDYLRGYIARHRPGRRGRRRRARLLRLVVHRQLRVGRGLRQALRPRLRRLPHPGAHPEGERRTGTGT